jgi:predicted RNase H-like HicB family nuclease
VTVTVEAELTSSLEHEMLTRYIQAALRAAHNEILTDDGTYYGEIPGFEGVWANAASLEECRQELEEVLEEWIQFRVSRQLPLPVVEGLELNSARWGDAARPFPGAS